MLFSSLPRPNTTKFPLPYARAVRAISSSGAACTILSASIERVILAEGFTAEPEAVQAVARSAEGSWRDALSILEQVLAYSDGHITAAIVHRALGTVGTEMLAQVTETLSGRRLGGNAWVSRPIWWTAERTCANC